MNRPLAPPSICLAFYNGRDYGTWLDRLVARHDHGASAGPFSHVELAFDARRGVETLCFSSSWRDGGVRFRHINLNERPVGSVAPKWTLVSVPASHRQVAEIRGWCGKHLGGRYDVPGVLAFKLPFVRQQLNWWFCSEICCAALQEGGMLLDVEPHRLSPNGLLRLSRRRFPSCAHAYV